MELFMEDLGDGVINIVSPVTICMVLTICMVRLLNPEGAEGNDTVAIASLYYKEQVKGAPWPKDQQTISLPAYVCKRGIRYETTPLRVSFLCAPARLAIPQT